MIKAKIIASAIYLTASCIHLHAQTAMTERLYSPSNTVNAKELNIGDNVPDIVFDNVLNYSARKAKLSDFKSSLTILDFWSTTCGSCIALFPHMQFLKDQFKNRLQIILVNGKTALFHDNESKIQSLFAKLQQRAGSTIDLPIVFNTEILDKYFPFISVPHEVWIDSLGKVVAITGATEVTEENISAFLNRKKIKMHTKKDVSLDLQKQTLSELACSSNTALNKPEYSSTIIKGYIDGLGGQGVRHADSSHAGLYTGWYIANQPLLRIYQTAYRNIIKYPLNRVVIEASNPVRFYKIYRHDTSMYSNVYSYDISVSPTNFEELLTYVQEDLERTFKTSVRPAVRKIKCYVLKTTPQLKRSFSKGTEQIWDTEIPTLKKYIRNYPLDEILGELNIYSTVPLIDETGLTKNIDLDLPYDLWNTDLLLQSLRMAGFDISEEEKQMNVVIISDK